MIILTGGAGFIGSCFLKKLNLEDISDVLIVDNFNKSEKWKNLIGKNFKIYINKYDFFNYLNEINNTDIKAIFHLGACSSTTELDFEYLYNNNFDFSKKLCEFSLKNEIPFFYASSAATYGMGELGFSDSLSKSLKPLNGYGFSKLLFDNWLIDNKLEDKVTGFRYFNVFGPNEYHKGSMSSMIYKSCNQILSNGQVKLFKSNDNEYNDGEQKRDFVYVKDVINIMWDSFKNNTKGIYNIGTSNARTWNDLVKSVFKSMDKEIIIEYIDMPENLKSQYQNFTESDNTNFNKKFNYKYQSLEESIDDYIKNHLLLDWKYF